MTNPTDEVHGTIEWVNRDAIRYTEGGYSVLVWVTSEPGFLRRRRVIQSSCLLEWENAPGLESTVIEPCQRERLIGEIRKYFLRQKVRCRVE